jgi:hypothetical protein
VSSIKVVGIDSLKDVLQFMISTYHKLCDECANQIMPNSLGDWEANAFDINLKKIMFHFMNCQSLEIFIPFTFFHGFERKRGHNILALMLDPMIKGYT